MAVPYTFATATTNLPLSQLDTNFAYFGNAITVEATSTSMVIKSSGNVGIGTSSPNAQLHVSGTTDTSYSIFGPLSGLVTAQDGKNAFLGYTHNNSAPSTLAFPTGVSGYGKLSSEGNNVFGVYGLAEIDSATGSVVGAEFTSRNFSGNAPDTNLPPNQNIGTSTTVPVGLQVTSGGANDSSLGISISPEASSTVRFNTGFYIRSNAITQYGLYVESSTGATASAIFKDKVGFGIASPNAQIQVVGSTTVSSQPNVAAVIGANATSELLLGSLNGNAPFVASQGAYPLLFNTNATERMRIDSSGNLLVGRTTNSSGNTARIAVSFTQNGQVFTPTTNDKFPIFFENAAGTTVGYIFTSSSATTYSTTSDYRLKDNVQPMITGLATVSALKPVTYDWKIDGSFGEGFIAHELQEHIPLAVTGEKDAVNKDGSIKPQGVDYSKIVVHLVAAIQELEARLSALEAK